jgi:phosphate:Na+ symporter
VPEILSFFAVYLTVFIFGMTVMRLGMEMLAKDKIKNILLRLTSSPFMGVVAGTLLTGLLQSSSAVMVITIGLVATGLLTFPRSLGIILGANIGTTFTTEIITFDISNGVIPLLVGGAFFILLRKQLFFNIGCMMFGLGSIFVAMAGFEQLASSIERLSLVTSVFNYANELHYVGVGIGTLVTAVIQSSTATTGIIMSFLKENSLTVDAGIAIMLGSNIGTCITAFIASIGTRKEAKLVAYAHIWLNLLGVIIFYPFISYLGNLAEYLTSIPDVQLAHASLLFNVICTVVALPFIHMFSKFIIRLHGANDKNLSPF